MQIIKTHTPIVHISKRTEIPLLKSIAIKVGAVIVALIFSAIISAILKPGTFGSFISNLFVGTFGTPTRVIKFFQEVAILLCIALAVTPAFKMKFWNIGAEGQVLMGALMSVVCVKYLGGSINNSLLLIIMFIAGVLGGAVWGVIPALFKAKWGTNETLFTLMLNYIAMGLISICIAVWVTSGSQVLGILKYGHLPQFGQYRYILNIIIVAILTIVAAIYLKYSKHGYEIAVVGESRNTAKYIGISVNKVIVRTMFLSGAICGLAGWLLVAGTSYTVTTDLAASRGFTAILVSWLGNFNPIVMIFTTMLVILFNQGASFAGSNFGFGTAFPEIITGVFFLIVIASEFFIGYTIRFDFSAFKKNKQIVVPQEENNETIIAKSVHEEIQEEKNEEDIVEENKEEIQEDKTIEESNKNEEVKE